MAKSFCILLNVLLAVNVILASEYEPEFQRVTPYIAPDGNMNLYYVSMSAAEHPTAARNCKEFFGENANLLSIDTEEEYEYLKTYLSEFSAGSKLWTSGMYDGSQWRWSDTMAVVPSFIEWVQGKPETSPAHRLGLFHLNRYSIELFSARQTVLYGYVCKIRKTAQKKCFKTSDLLVLLDLSGSIDQADYEKAKLFVDKLLKAFTVHPSNRVAFITFSDQPSTIFNLTNKLTSREISTRIMNALQFRGSTNSANRNHPRNVVVITDGLSDRPNETIKAANEINNMDVGIYSVGVGPRISYEELLKIAAGDATRVFTVQRMDDIMKLLNPLIEKICSA